MEKIEQIQINLLGIDFKGFFEIINEFDCKMTK